MKTEDPAVIEPWRRLQTSDHFYYMCTKWFQDGDVHAYFSPYESPYDAYIAFMNALSDLQLRVHHALLKQEERVVEKNEPVEMPVPTHTAVRVPVRAITWFDEMKRFIEIGWSVVKTKISFAYARLKKHISS